MTENLKLLDGKRILLVEDEFLASEKACRMLEKCGAHIVGPVTSVADGIDLVNNGDVDAAVLDVELDGQAVFPLADLLESLESPFLFAIGCNGCLLTERYSGYVFCERPAHLDTIAKALFAPTSRYH